MTTKAGLEAHIASLREQNDQTIQIEQLRTQQHSLELLHVVARMLASGMSATDETYQAMTAVSKAREAIEAKRDRELLRYGNRHGRLSQRWLLESLGLPIPEELTQASFQELQS